MQIHLIQLEQERATLSGRQSAKDCHLGRSCVKKGRQQVEGSAQGLPPEILFGSSDEMKRIRRTVERICQIRVPILIRGESGTGKEMLANYLHGQSPWQAKPFIKVNCAAVPGPLLESELFGYEKGAFTGAYSSRPGKFEMAHEGTLVLDEIADMDGGLQAKLLHALQDGRFSRIGDLEERHADVRIISISNRNIEQDIGNGTFREDLFYRINVVNLELPPLRRRIEDLPMLIDYFLRSFSKQFHRDVTKIPSELLDPFRNHRWPGNIRELENYIKCYVILGKIDGRIADIRDRVPVVTNGFQLQRPDDFALKKFAKSAALEAERFLILEALKETRWNRRRAARLLGISYRALLYKMQDAGLPSKKQPRRADGEGEPVPSAEAPLPG